MTTLAIQEPQNRVIALPPPRAGAIAIRQAVMSDLKFIDGLQKQHSKMVGFAPRKQLEANITHDNVLIAEDAATREPVGYCIYKDRYLKREELGVVYQLNIVPGKQRKLIGASLVKAAFDRCPYGVKLFCCWCAQDIEANRFWESLGFVPLAFRTGSRTFGGAGSKKTPRIHIFWQRRVREADTETPYWFPSETQGGAMKENRLVLPIPPGTHWSGAKPAVLPGAEEDTSDTQTAMKETKRSPRSKVAPAKPKRGLWFASAAPTAEAKLDKPKPRREKHKNDPKHIAAARELRDRYLEQVNALGGRMLPAGGANGKYDVSRQLEAATSTLGAKQMPPPSPHHLLKAA